MAEPNEKLDRAFYTLSYLGAVILGGNLLDSEDGRERVKQIFKAGLLAGGSYEALLEIPEFARAVKDYETGVLTVDPSELSPVPAVDTEGK